MEKNIGDLDSKVRVALGAVLVAVGGAGYSGAIPIANIAPQALTSVLLSVIGIVLVLTGYFQRCMLYRVLGADTSED